MSDSLQSHKLQHARLPCPSLSPGVCLNSCPLNQWYHPTISLSVVPFSCLQSFPAPASFPVSQLFPSDSQSIVASASVLPINIQGWFLSGLTGLISLLSKGLSRVFSSTTIWKHQLFNAQPSLWSNSYIPTWLLEKPSYIIWTFVDKVMFLLFNTLSRFFIDFLPRSKCLNFVAAVTIHSDFRAQQNLSLLPYFHQFDMKWWD